MIRRALVLLAALAPLPAAAEHPAVDAAAANLWVKRAPPRAEAADLQMKDRHGRVREARNTSAGVPGMTITVEFPPESAELDDAQRLALHMLTRELRADPKVRLLWVRAGTDMEPHETGGAALARKRAEALRRATGGKGFPWENIFLDAPLPPCGADACRRTNRQGIITVIEAR